MNKALTGRWMPWGRFRWYQTAEEQALTSRPDDGYCLHGWPVDADCPDCQSLRRNQYTRRLEHPSRYDYVRGCRCDGCKAANAAYMTEWNHRTGRTQAGRPTGRPPGAQTGREVKP